MGTYIDVGSVVDNSVLNDLLQLFFGDTKRGLYLVEGAYKVVPIDTEVLDIVRDPGNCPNLGGVGFASKAVRSPHPP